MHLIIEPYVRNKNFVLGQSSGFVRANDGGRTKSFDGLEVLDKTIFGSHFLGRQCKGDCHGYKETLWHHGNDGADEEDDGIEPVVSEKDGNDEEHDTEEDGEVDHVLDEDGQLLGYECFFWLNVNGKSGNSSNDGVLPDADDHSASRTFHGICRAEGHVLGLHRIVVRQGGTFYQRPGFTGQR